MIAAVASTGCCFQLTGGSRQLIIAGKCAAKNANNKAGCYIAIFAAPGSLIQPGLKCQAVSKANHAKQHWN